MIYDVVVIGGGPAGLMAAITASQGTPVIIPGQKKEGLAKILILESYRKCGGIAAYGEIVFTDYWSIHGGKIKSLLLQQAKELPIQIETGADVAEIEEATNGFSILTRDGKRFAGRQVVIACGIFSHLEKLKYTNSTFLAIDHADQEKFIKWAESEVLQKQHLSRKILLVGVNEAVIATAKRLAQLTTILTVEPVIASQHSSTDKSLDEILDQAYAPSEQYESTDRTATSYTWNDGSAGEQSKYLRICFDYNSYKIHPENASRIKTPQPLAEKNGYLVTDMWYRTSSEGIWACGNAAFPLSGVLQALYSGFTTGLALRGKLEVASHDDIQSLLPWLPFPNTNWRQWL